MSELLTHEQCDAFMKAYAGVHLRFTGHDWVVNHPTSPEKRYLRKTKEEAITDYWRQNERTWTPPPPVHDAEWALAQAKQHYLAIFFLEDDPTASCQICGRNQSKGFSCFGKTLAEAVENWLAKYNKPELPSAIEMLQQARDMLTGFAGVDHEEWLEKLDIVIAREEEAANE